MKGISRTAFARLFWIYRQLLQGKPLNAFTAAQSQGVNEKTIRRDLTFLRRVLGVRVRYCGADYLWMLEGECNCPVCESQLEPKDPRTAAKNWRWRVRNRTRNLRRLGDLPDREYSLGRFL